MVRRAAQLLLVALAVVWPVPTAPKKVPEFNTSAVQCGGNSTVFANAAASMPHAGRPCDLCNTYRLVFIISTGRSGSTTMLAMLNAIPGFEISGEQLHPLEVKLCQDALDELEQRAIISAAAGEPRIGISTGNGDHRHDSDQHRRRRRQLDVQRHSTASTSNNGTAGANIAGTTQQNTNTNSENHTASNGDDDGCRGNRKPVATTIGKEVVAFFHPDDGGCEETALAHERAAQAVAKAGDPHWWCLAQQAELESMELAHPPVGTVAVGRKAIRLDQLATLEFLRALFPCAQFVLTYRLDEAKQAKSAFWKKVPRDRVASKLGNQTAALLEFEQLHRDQVFAMPLENISVPRYNKLLAWLGVHNCSFTGVAHANNRGGYRGANGTNLLHGTCALDSHS